MKKHLLRLLTVVLFLIAPLKMCADLTTGYYTLKNVGYDGYYMYEDFTSNCVRATSSAYSSGDYEKVWKITVSDGTVTIQNVYTGHYIQTQSSTSATYTTGSTSTSFALTANSDGSYMFAGYMHCDGSKNVVQWGASDNNHSWWVATAVSLTDDEVTAAQAEYNASATINTNRSTYNTALATFFTDLSCSELKSTYSSYSETDLKSAMNTAGLPSSLQEVGASVLKQWSGETDPTIVKQFRVQTYKPYTRAYYSRDKLNATQFNDMSNPTGIYANAKKDLLVFVGGTIPDGCSLRIAGGTGNTLLTYTAGTELQQGVNAIKASADLTQFWIMYTYTSDTQVDMSTLSSLKIHIEGGTVLGYVNAADKTESEINTEYKKILDHANTVTTANGVDDGNVNFVVKGNRGVFFFPLDTYNAIWAGTNYGSNTYNTYEIGKSIDFFDSVLKWEWSVMGHMKRVVDGECDPTKNSSTHENLTGGRSLYPTYYNNLALTLQGASGSNPFSTTGYTSMPAVSGVESSYNAERVNFDNWCVGHESGHNNQGLINLPSSTESSNNLFSNVIQYQWGYRMSRGASVADANSYYVDGTQFALRDIGTTHRMYWQLYLYFHVAKNNTAFYPTFFNLLRNDPMDLDEGTCFTDFYEKACEAAGQDLTSFFTVWGFLQPFENTTFGDYTSRTLTLTQTEIDEAKARVAAKVAAGTYTSDNLEIMFIEDRTETATRWDPFSTGTEQKVSSDGYEVTAASLASSYGTMGSVSSMTSGSTSSDTGDFVYSITDATLTLSGTSAGAGVIVYDADGNIIAYGNSTNIRIPSTISNYSQITVKAVATDGTVTEAKSVIDAGTDAQKLTTLQSLVAAANEYIALEDDTETKVGYYKASYLTDLKSLVSQANTAITNSVTSSYASLITSLTEEIARVKAIDDLTIKIVAGNSYSIRNANYTTRYASVSSSKLVTNTNTTLTNAEKWQFVPTSSDTYYIYNVGSKTYVSYSATSTQAQANATSTDGTATTSSTDVAYTYNIVANGDGTFYLQANEAAGYKCWHSAWNDSYNIVGWTAGADASKWYITLTDETEEGEALDDLTSSISQATALLDKVNSSWETTYTLTPLTLQTTNSSGSYYISTNAQQTTEGPIANLVDGDVSTFFHSRWSGTAVTENHYIKVDMGDENLIDQFVWNFTNRLHSTYAESSGMNSPTNVIISGSNDDATYTEITTLTTGDGLPTATGSQSSFTSATLGKDGTNYRYLKFTVTNTNTGSKFGDYVYFSLGEMTLSSATPSATYTYNTAYSSLTASKNEALILALNTAQTALVSGTTAERTAANTALVSAYTALKAEADAAEKDPYKTQLQTLITNTNTLLGTVMEDGYTYNSGATTALTMQTTDSSAPYYVSTNHDESVEGSKSLTADAVGIKNLVDGSSSTYFHSTWSTATTDQHYWQIDLGSDNDVDVFSFSITPESDHTGNFPNDIIIQGSSDGNTFTQVAELTSSSTPALPSSESTATYTSGTITSSTAYRYWRFVVNGTVSGNGNNSSHKYPFFALTEFTMTIGSPIQSLTGTKNTGYESVSDELVITAASEKDKASSMISAANYSSTSANALKYEVTALQNAYDALKEAANTKRAELLAAIQAAQAVVNGYSLTPVGTDPGYYPGTTAISTAITAAQAVYDNSASTKAQIEAQITALSDATTAAQTMIMPQAGHYYRLISAYPAFYTSQSVYKAAYCDETKMMWATLDNTDYSQVWYVSAVDGTTITMRNAYNGYYPKNSYGVQTDANTTVITLLSDGEFTIKPTGCSYMMHTEGHSSGAGVSGNICGWDDGKDSGSAWYIRECESNLSEEVMASLQTAYTEVKTTYLDEVDNSKPLVKYNSESAATLQTLYDNAKTAYESTTKTETLDYLGALYTFNSNKAAAIAALSKGFLNDKTYLISNLGTTTINLYYDGTYNYARAGEEAATTNTTNHEWAIYTYDGKTYMYNLGAAKMLHGVTGTGGHYSWPFDNNTVHAIDIAYNETNSYYSFRDENCTGSQDYLHYNSSYSYGTTNWGLGTNNSWWTIALADDELTSDQQSTILALVESGVSKTQLAEAYAKYSAYTESTAVGCVSDLSSLETPLSTANTLLTADTYDKTAGDAAYTALITAANALVYNMPTTGFWRIKNKASGNYLLGYGDSGWQAHISSDLAESVFYIEKSDDSYYFLNQYTGLYVNNAWNYNQSADNKGAWTITLGSTYGTVALYGNNNTYIQDLSGSGYAAWNSNEINDNSSWQIVPVEDFSVTIGSTGYATLALPFNGTQSSGASIYAGSYDSDNSKVKLVESGSVLKAKDGFIIYGTPGTYTFTPTMDKTSSTDNCLTGVIVKTDLSALTGGTVYLLAKGTKGIGFYKWAAKTTGTEEENEASKYLAANKAYLFIADTGAREFIPLGDENEDVTGVNSVNETNEQESIYTLNGQRVSKTQKGSFYIINGRKVFVR